MKPNTLNALIASAVLICSGCASIVSKTERSVRFDSDPSQAQLTVADGEGKEIYSGETPATLKLKTKRSYFKGQSYTVTFAKPGYQSQTLQIASTINGWYFGNFFFGGLLGMLVVDPLTGAMWTLTPEKFNAHLAATQAAGGDSDAVLQVVLLKDVPSDLRGNLLRVR